MRICFDLDNTLCYGRPYENAQPIPGRAKLLKDLRADGHVVIIYTARFMSTCEYNVGKVIKSIGKMTLEQLDSWGFEYDEIYFGKPSADIYVDDKALHVSGIGNIRNLMNVMQAKRHQIDCAQKNTCDKIDKLVQLVDSLQEK